MFNVDENTMAVTLHKGDTGAYTVTLELEDGEDFVDGDVAIYEMWQGTTRLIHREFNLQPDEPTYTEYGDGVFLIYFRNSDTDSLSSGTYNTEIRVALNPIRSSGAVVDGDTVRTIVQSTVTINDVRIQI